MEFHHFLETCFKINTTDALEEYLYVEISQGDREIDALNTLEREIWSFIHLYNLQSDIVDNIYWNPFFQIYVMEYTFNLESKTDVLGMMLRYISLKKIN